MVYHLVTSNAIFDYIHTFDSFFLSFFPQLLLPPRLRFYDLKNEAVVEALWIHIPLFTTSSTS